jgi:hypothetical protein
MVSTAVVATATTWPYWLSFYAQHDVPRLAFLTGWCIVTKWHTSKAPVSAVPDVTPSVSPKTRFCKSITADARTARR